MIIKICIRILIMATLIVEIVQNGFCLTNLETENQIHDDFKIVFVLEPKGSESIFDKYGEEKYFATFSKIMAAGEYSDELIFEVIYLSAVLRDVRYLEYVRKISPSRHVAIDDVMQFYYYRIGFNRADSVEFLEQKLNDLIENPTDSYLITFLAFFDSIDLSLSYMDKVARVADGASSELLNWAFNYLYYKNMNNPSALKKLEGSYCYKLYKKRE